MHWLLFALINLAILFVLLSVSIYQQMFTFRLFGLTPALLGLPAGHNPGSYLHLSVLCTSPCFSTTQASRVSEMLQSAKGIPVALWPPCESWKDPGKSCQWSVCLCATSQWVRNEYDWERLFSFCFVFYLCYLKATSDWQIISRPGSGSNILCNCLILNNPVFCVSLLSSWTNARWWPLKRSPCGWSSVPCRRPPLPHLLE